MGYADLPHINAALNALTLALLLAARLAIARRAVPRHRALMLAALTVSALFLVSYLAYHAAAPIFRYGGDWHRLYYTLLVSHVILAALSLPLIARSAWLGWRRIEGPHRAWARFTFPLWVYVSASGLAVYAMLYR